MRLDIRLPLGLLFSILGALLVITGLVSDTAPRARALGVNVNLAWGAVLVLFGAAMLLLARGAAKAGGSRPAVDNVKPPQ